MTIFNYKCYQWRVRNKEKNTEVAYWVFNDDFNFFNDLFKIPEDYEISR
ncbi:MAG: hypothetical protein IIB05_02460 [Bacteroidetes bacterium]|nr:hypothetical protein [Bacteroidota bacterium]